MLSPSAVFERLGAPLTNVNWSWGAQRSDGAIFLRVWQDETRLLEDGTRVVRLANHAVYADAETNLGYNERLRHLDALRGGSTGYAVFCLAETPTPGNRRIKSIDQRDVIRLGAIVEIDGDEWAVMVARVPMKSIEL